MSLGKVPRPTGQQFTPMLNWLDALNLQDLPPVDLGGGTITKYVRPIGNDVTGDGTLAKPYSTINRAVKDVGSFINNGTFNVNCDGYGVDSSEPSTIVIPAFYGLGQNGGTLSITAVPTVLLSMAPADFSTSVPSPVLTLITATNLAAFT